MSNWAVVGQHINVAIPAADAAVTGSMRLTDGNTLEVRGQITAGTGALYLLRKTWNPARTHFQFIPFKTYVGIEKGPAEVAGYFYDVIAVGQTIVDEDFAIWNPSALTVSDIYMRSVSL